MTIYLYAIYTAGDGPFQNTLVDPGAKLGKENELLHPVETRRLNAMLLTLWKIVCLSDPPIYVPRVRCRRHIRNYPKPLNFFL